MRFHFILSHKPSTSFNTDKITKLFCGTKQNTSEVTSSLNLRKFNSFDLSFDPSTHSTTISRIHSDPLYCFRILRTTIYTATSSFSTARSSQLDLQRPIFTPPSTQLNGFNEHGSRKVTISRRAGKLYSSRRRATRNFAYSPLFS